MKKTLRFTLLILIICIMFSISVYASEKPSPYVKVWVENNDIQFDIKPYIDENNRTLIPIRFVSEALGANVTWNQEKQEVTIKDNGKTIKLVIGSNELSVDGIKQKMDTKAIINSGRTFVPVRFVSEALGAIVAWDQEYYIVKINRNTVVEETDIATIMSKKFPIGIEELDPYLDGIILYKDSYCRFSVHNNNGADIKNIEIYYFPYEGQVEIANEMLMYALKYLYPYDYAKVYADALEFAKPEDEYTFLDITHKDRHTFFGCSPGNYGVCVCAYEKGYIRSY